MLIISSGKIANTDDLSNLLASAALDGGSQVIMFILVSPAGLLR